MAEVAEREPHSLQTARQARQLPIGTSEPRNGWLHELPPLRIAHWFRLTKNDGFPCWLPLFHSGGDESLYATLTTGRSFRNVTQGQFVTMFSMIERGV